MKRQYALDETFFDRWNPQMAYMVGYILADGSLDARNYAVRLVSVDQDLLESIRAVFAPNHPIRVNDMTKYNPNRKPLYRLMVQGKYLYGGLTNLGITPRKSKVATLPPVPDEMFPYFLRGLFDGDGSVSILSGRYSVLSANISGAEDLLKAIGVRLLNCGIANRVNQGKGCWQLGITCRAARRFGIFIYGDQMMPLCLQRKRAIFEAAGAFKQSPLFWQS